MSSLEALTGTGVYAREPGGVSAAPSSFVEATVATTPTAVDEEVMVLVGAEGSQLQAGPCRWEPRVIPAGLLFPTRGDPCLVVTGDKGHRALVWWKPLAPAPVLPEIPRVVGAASQPPFLNGWSNFDTATYDPASFWVDPIGMVHLAGLVKSGTMAATAFTLPVGYRPAKAKVIVTDSNLAHGRVSILPDGSVQPWTGSNIYFSLDGVSFRAA